MLVFSFCCAASSAVSRLALVLTYDLSHTRRLAATHVLRVVGRLGALHFSCVQYCSGYDLFLYTNSRIPGVIEQVVHTFVITLMYFGLCLPLCRTPGIGKILPYCAWCRLLLPKFGVYLEPDGSLIVLQWT